MRLTMKRLAQVVIGLTTGMGLGLALAGCAGTAPGPTVEPSGAGTVPVAAGTVPAADQPLSAGTVPAAEQPLAPEVNPPGDIPDEQAFVQYTAVPGGYALEAPEGWARTTSGSDVRFEDKLDGEAVAISDATSAPTAATVRLNEVAKLQQSDRAVRDVAVEFVKLPSGPAVLIKYTSNSDPSPVSGKQVRLENNRYLLYKDGRLATLTLWAPSGADNVDQWQRIAGSFRWSR